VPNNQNLLFLIVAITYCGVTLIPLSNLHKTPDIRPSKRSYTDEDIVKIEKIPVDFIN